MAGVRNRASMTKAIENSACKIGKRRGFFVAVSTAMAFFVSSAGAAEPTYIECRFEDPSSIVLDLDTDARRLSKLTEIQRSEANIDAWQRTS
jgi:hypothetical protein